MHKAAKHQPRHDKIFVNNALVIITYQLNRQCLIGVECSLAITPAGESGLQSDARQHFMLRRYTVTRRASRRRTMVAMTEAMTR